MALTKIGTDGVKDDAVTSDKVANAINSAIAANTAKTQTTINNNADNRVITGSGTANTLNAESNVVIDSSGNVGIGMTTVGAALDVNGASGDTLRLSNGSAAYQYRIGRNNTDGKLEFYGTQSGDVAYTFGGVDGERIRIESTGNLQIARDKYIGTVGSGKSSINIGTSGGAQIGFHKINSNDDDIRFYTHVSGSFHGERMRILAGGGITFNGDTAAANAISDYEEGEVTITTTASNGNAITVNSSYNKLTYTKIGNVVHVWGYVLISANSNADGYLQINSLPFIVKNAHGASGHMRAVNTAYFNRNTAYLPDGAGYYNVQLYANENNSWLVVYDLNASGRRVDTCAKFLGANSVININFSYLTV